MKYFIEISRNSDGDVLLPYEKAGIVYEYEDDQYKTLTKSDLQGVKLKTLKNCNLPLEIREVLKENINCKFVRKDPDYYVYSKESFNKIFYIERLVHIDDFLRAMKADLGRLPYWNLVDAELKEMKKNHSDCYVLMDRFHFIHKNSGFIVLNNVRGSYTRHNIVYNKNLETFNKIVNCKSVLNTNLIELIADEGEVIDKDSYLNLSKMFNSQSRKDIDLAVNSILFSSWEKSYAYITLLISFNDNFDTNKLTGTSLGTAFLDYFSDVVHLNYNITRIGSLYFRTEEIIKIFKNKKLLDDDIKDLISMKINSFIRTKVLDHFQNVSNFEIVEGDIIKLKID